MPGPGCTLVREMKARILLTALMLLTAQVPLLACPCPENGGLHPALNDDHDARGHHHHHGHSHSHSHAHHSHDPVTQDDERVEAPPHVHGLLSTPLVVTGARAELPATAAVLAAIPASLPPAGDEVVRTEGGAALAPPPQRPPSAACLADAVRLLA